MQSENETTILTLGEWERNHSLANRTNEANVTTISELVASAPAKPKHQKNSIITLDYWKLTFNNNSCTIMPFRSSMGKNQSDKIEEWCSKTVLRVSNNSKSSQKHRSKEMLRKQLELRWQQLSRDIRYQIRSKND